MAAAIELLNGGQCLVGDQMPQLLYGGGIGAATIVPLNGYEIEQLNAATIVPLNGYEIEQLKCMMGIDAYDAASYGVGGIYSDLTTKLEGTVIGTIVFLVQLLRPISAVASGIHGYYRNCENWGAALGWGALGFLFPVIVPTVSLIQGYSKEKTAC